MDLLRLPDRGADALQDALTMAQRGDWQTRALCWSAAGRIAAAETTTTRAVRWIARRLPGQWERFPSAGHQGKYVRHFIANGLADRVWPVRTAAALALGECGSPSSISVLRDHLRAPFRAERIAAVSALIACGGTIDEIPTALLHGALPAPSRIGETTASTEFLAILASCHRSVLGGWRRFASDADSPVDDTPRAWAECLAGPASRTTYGGPQSEIERYAASDTAYLLEKPFTAVNRTQNIHLLHTFLAVAEQLRLPPGSRVLDLGGGSGWVSELLERLGFRTVTLDISTVLLGIGKGRFRRGGMTPSFVAADMTRLPIADATMDAVVVVDALHHVPDRRAVFGEAFRVLAQGGCFVLAEPGEGHSETIKARNEVLDYGLQEGEIHLFDAVAAGRAAGFDDVRVVPHHSPAATMSPDALRDAMLAPADRWRVDHRGRSDPYVEFVFHSIFDNPIVAFGKGRRPVDSRSPGRLAAEIRPDLSRERHNLRGTVVVRNAGDTVWLGGGSATGHVRVGIQLLDGNRRPLDPEYGRLALPADVAAGGIAVVEVGLELPEPEASYVLKIDLVAEGICWFEDAGSAPLYVPV